MATKLLLLADTHIPKRARVLPAPVWQAVAEADIVLHAGDWISGAFLDELQGRARRLIGCYGNNDGPDVSSRLPLIAAETIEGLRVAVIHETGAAPGREARMDRQFPETDVLVFGHSHIPWDTTTPNGLRLLNPGSPTDRRRQPHCTYLSAVVDGTGISTQLHRL